MSRKNIVRRSAGLVIGLFPVLLLVASIAAGFSGLQLRVPGGLGFMVAASIVAVMNFYLSFVRGRIYLIRHGSREGYRHVSGLPLIGTALVVIGVLLGFGDIGGALLGMAVMLVDTGGSVWFLFSTWRDGSFWDS